MSQFEELLERLIVDDRFRQLLADDPDRALSDYHLTDDERRILDSAVAESAGPVGVGAVEGRQSKSAMIGLLSQFADLGGDSVAFNPQPEPPADGHDGFSPSGERDGVVVINSQPDSDAVAFNPQPEPPAGEHSGLGPPGEQEGIVVINGQPDTDLVSGGPADDNLSGLRHGFEHGH